MYKQTRALFIDACSPCVMLTSLRPADWTCHNPSLRPLFTSRSSSPGVFLFWPAFYLHADKTLFAAWGCDWHAVPCRTGFISGQSDSHGFASLVMVLPGTRLREDTQKLCCKSYPVEPWYSLYNIYGYRCIRLALSM